MNSDVPTVFAADVDDPLECSMVDDGFDVLQVILTQVNQDLTERNRHLSGEVGAGVVVGKHLHNLWQHLRGFRKKKA